MQLSKQVQGAAQTGTVDVSKQVQGATQWLLYSVKQVQSRYHKGTGYAVMAIVPC